MRKVLRRLARTIGPILIALVTVGILVLVLELYEERQMGACDISYTIITPDGATFNLDGSRWRMGTSRSKIGHTGFGLPPVQHITQQVYDMPGALLKDIKVNPRVVTLTMTVWTDNRTRKQLHEVKEVLQDALRWDRGDEWEPTVLRYTIDGVSRDLHVFYAGSEEAEVTPLGHQEIIGIRLVAYDPLWYDDEESDLVLDWGDSFAMLHAIGRVGGIWDPLGPPAAVAAGIAGPDVYAVAVDPETGDVYFGGDFTNWDNNGLSDYLVRWNATTLAWENVGDDGAAGPALNERVQCLYFGPDNTLFVGGRFTNAGGGAWRDYIATVDVAADVWGAPAAAPNEVAGRIVYDVIVGNDGFIYITGFFTNWSGLGSPAGDYVARAMPGGAWVTVDNGFNGMGTCLAKAPNGDIVAGGSFTQAGGNVRNRVAWYDVAADSWLDMDDGSPGGGTAVDNLAFAPDGTLYATGNIPTMGSGPTTVNNFAVWNGVIWAPCGSGLDNIGYGLVVSDDGSAYVTGAFSLAGGLVVDRIARWNGHAWVYVDIEFGGVGVFYRGIALAPNGDLYVGNRTNATVEVAGNTSVVNLGNALAYPIIEIKNAGLLKTTVNETTDDELMFDIQLLDGEILTIDMSSGVKTMETNWRGNALGYLLPNSDLGTFKLESDPRAAYGGVAGANLITVFITDADPRETGDNNNQLSDWENITGIAQSNTDLGRLYVEIWSDGPWYQVFLYKDAARSQRVGASQIYPNGYLGGLVFITEENDSGLGGSINVDATVAADIDIEVIYTIVTMFWYDRWWDIDAAVS